MPVPDVCERAGEGCDGRMNALRTGKASEDRARQSRQGSRLQLRAPSRRTCADVRGCGIPRSKTIYAKRTQAAAHEYSITHTLDTSAILSRLHRRAKTRDAIACSLITVSLSRLTLLNFPSHTVPYTATPMATIECQKSMTVVERAAVGGVHFFAFRSPTGLSSVRQLVHFFAFRLPKLSDRATLANPPIT